MKKIFVNKTIMTVLAIIFSISIVPVSFACTPPELVFEDIVISSRIDKDTYMPLDEKDEFEASTEDIYATIVYSSAKGEDNYRFKWTNLDTGQIIADAENRYANDMKGKYITGIAFARVSSEDFESKIIPSGDYRVDYYHNGEVVKTATFKVTKQEPNILGLTFTNQIDEDYAPVGAVQEFNADETVYACVEFDILTIGTSVKAKWKSGTGEIVDEASIDMMEDYFSPTYITFWYPPEDSGPIAAGSYTVEIYLNDNLYGTYDFEVVGEPEISAGDRIIFTSNRDGNWEVYIMNPDGTGLSNLTNNEADDFEAVGTSDGEIIFVSDRDGDNEIYVMKLDGTDLVNITNNEVQDISPAVSPDNNLLAFASDANGNFDIYVIDKDGNVANLTNDVSDDDRPAWNSESTKIFFESNRWGDYELYVMNLAGDEIVNLTNNKADDENLKVSPDNSNIVFTSGRDGNWELYLLSQEGNITRLTDNDADDFNPAWSPDGSKIAFSTNRDGNYEIYIMNADGSDQTRVTINEADDLEPSWYQNLE